jgi:hypothetical protein
MGNMPHNPRRKQASDRREENKAGVNAIVIISRNVPHKRSKNRQESANTGYGQQAACPVYHLPTIGVLRVIQYCFSDCKPFKPWLGFGRCWRWFGYLRNNKKQGCFPTMRARDTLASLLGFKFDVGSAVLAGTFCVHLQATIKPERPRCK